MVGSFWLNVEPGGCPGTRVMTIFVFYVGPHFPNIQYFDVCGVFEGTQSYLEVYEGIWRYIKVYEGI